MAWISAWDTEDDARELEGALGKSAACWHANALGLSQRDYTIGSDIHVPGAGRIDVPLVLGSVTFGVGWVLVGSCPGPALTALAVGGRSTLLFVAAMVAGMAIFEVAERIRAGTEASRGATRAAAGPPGD